jgi:hypothetical protein
MQGGATGTGTVTLLAPVTSTDRTLTLPDSNGTIVTSATAGVPINGPAFSAYLSTAQTVTNATFTKVSCNIEEFDTNSTYDNATNYRFTPTVAGYYQVSGQIVTNTTVAITRLFLSIYKNGALFKYGVDMPTNGNRVIVSTLIYCNGSTDYLEMYGFIVGSGTLSFNGTGAPDCYFQAAMVRSA